MNEFQPGFRVREVVLADGRTLTLGLTCRVLADEELLDAAREAAERLAFDRARASIAHAHHQAGKTSPTDHPLVADAQRDTVVKITLPHEERGGQ